MLEHDPIKNVVIFLTTKPYNKSMKNLINVGEIFPYALKFDLKMKLTVYLFIISLFQIQANTYSQLTKISMDLDDVTVEKVLLAIEEKTEFKILYNDSEVDYSRKVSVNVEDELVFKILDNLFDKTKITYEIVDKQIVLLNNPSKPLTKPVVQQTKTITGTVLDDTGGPLPGASVMVQGTNVGGTTDFDGNFSLEAPLSATTIIVSYMGFKSKTVSIGDGTGISVALEPDSATLDEVIVVGYGTVKKSDVTGSISSISAKSFEDQPLARVEDALQGRAAGVSVAKQSGTPGGPVKVRIRGANSITGNNDPLVVVDGIIGGDLSTINPNDIASMEVLKDASATAIYGSRGANGVILISTKKGTGKSKMDVDYFTSFSTVPKMLESLGADAANFARIENSKRGSEFIPQSEIDELAKSGGTNYQDLLFRTAISHNLQLSMSGGTEDFNYFVSGNYLNQEGVVQTTGYQRFSIRSNVNAKITNKFKVGTNIYASRGKTTNDIEQFGRYQGTLVTHAIAWDPTTPLVNDAGMNNERSSRELASLNYNPIHRLNLSDLQRIEDRLNVNFNLSYDIVESLNFSVVAGASTIGITNENLKMDYEAPDANFNSTKNTNYQVSNILTWKKSFGKNNIVATGLYEFSKGQSRWNAYAANDLIGPAGFYFAELNKGYSISNNKVETGISSFMARVGYDWDKIFFLTGTIRSDSSSRFQGENKTGTFYSFASSYSFSNMSFIEDSDVLSNLKVRAGWGQVGNQDIAAYSTFPEVSINQKYSFNGLPAPVQGSTIAGIGNPDTTWETTTQLNIGVDLGFLNNKYSLSLDWYKKNTTDLLLNVPIPETLAGVNISQIQNVGEVQNTGFDITLGANFIDNDNFRWDANLTMSKIKNEVVSLYDGKTEIQGTFASTDGQGDIWNIIQVGEPLGQFQGATFLGTWKSTDDIPLDPDSGNPIAVPGDAKYLLDADNEKVIGAIGNGTPDFMWGFNNTFTYKNWDINLFIQGVHGFDVYNTTRAIIVGASGNQRSYMHPEQLNQWTPTNETNIPATGENVYGSTRYVEKGDYIRLSNLNIGYTFRNIKGIETLKIYGGGQNLFLISQYSGYDPELSSRPADVAVNPANTDSAVGIDAGAYPNPRIFSIGAKFQL